MSNIPQQFCVPDVVQRVEWSPYPGHICGKDLCVSKFSLVWKPECLTAYVEELERNLEMPVQLEDALEAGNVDAACFCLRIWIMQGLQGFTRGWPTARDSG